LDHFHRTARGSFVQLAMPWPTGIASFESQSVLQVSLLPAPVEPSKTTVGTAAAGCVAEFVMKVVLVEGMYGRTRFQAFS
jgi:hypothetical protein